MRTPFNIRRFLIGKDGIRKEKGGRGPGRRRVSSFIPPSPPPPPLPTTVVNYYVPRPLPLSLPHTKSYQRQKLRHNCDQWQRRNNHNDQSEASNIFPGVMRDEI